jgi:hypothetical protein
VRGRRLRPIESGKEAIWESRLLNWEIKTREWLAKAAQERASRRLVSPCPFFSSIRDLGHVFSSFRQQSSELIEWTLVKCGAHTCLGQSVTSFFFLRHRKPLLGNPVEKRFPYHFSTIVFLVLIPSCRGRPQCQGSPSGCVSPVACESSESTHGTST